MPTPPTDPSAPPIAPFFVVLPRGTDVRSGILQAVADRGVKTAAIQGIGALERVELGFFDRAARTYRRGRVDEVSELLNLSGNIVLDQGSPFLHAHAVLGLSDFTTRGGHFFDGIVAVTAEIAITPHTDIRHRDADDDTGLRLILDL